MKKMIFYSVVEPFPEKDKINWLLDLLYEQNRVVPVIEGKTLCVAPNFDL